MHIPPSFPTEKPVSRAKRAWFWVRQVSFSPLGMGVWALAVFGIVSFVATFSQNALSAKEDALANGDAALASVTQAASALAEQDFSAATVAFNGAAERLIEVDRSVQDVSYGLDDILAFLPIRTSVTSQAELVEAGVDLAIAGTHVSKALEVFSHSGAILEPFSTGVEASASDETIPFTNQLEISLQSLEVAQVKLAEAELHMERVRTEDLPENMQAQAATLQAVLPSVVSLVDTTMAQGDMLLTLLGHERRQTYVVLFQNDHELRPTGGFIGTVAFITFDQGRIQQLLVEGPYRYDGQLDEVRVAPEPLRLIQARSFSRDMNWFLDFPTSAEQVALYLDKAGAPTVDGVVALNASIMEDLLEITGPVTVPGYETTVDAETFYEETQREVELDYDREKNRPKAFVGDMIPSVLEAAFSGGEHLPAISELIVSSLEERDVMIWFEDERPQRVVEELGYDGGIVPAERDYLSLVSTNIGGGKTDAVIETELDHVADVQPDGSIINTVTVTRSHTGNPDDFWEGIKNMSYLRLYVPLGSELISIEGDGFDSEFWDALWPPDEGSQPDERIAALEETTYIHEPTRTRVQQETGRTTFGNWMGLEVGETKTVTFQYRLPFSLERASSNLTSTYSLYLQKQPAARNTTVRSRVQYGTSRSALWQYVNQSELEEGDHARSVSLESLDRDLHYAVIVEPSSR